MLRENETLVEYRRLVRKDQIYLNKNCSYSDFKIILKFLDKSTYKIEDTRHFRGIKLIDVIQRKLNQTDQDVEFEVYDGKIKLDKTKTIMKNRVWPGERVRLDIYHSYKIKDTIDTIRKSLSGTILTEMHKIQVKLLLDRSQKYKRLSRSLSADLLTGIVTL